MTFVDANVLLEVILRRTRAATCEDFLSNNENKAISTLSLDLVMYFIERDNLAWKPIKTFLESFSWLPIVEADAQWAFAQFIGGDFEDALQVACAIREGCSKFVTLGGPLSKKYSGNIAINLLR
ncbi:MAG: type II toxin-antitoxin system VapC family toxin [Candidatus Saccharimonadales bacterium]